MENPRNHKKLIELDRADNHGERYLPHRGNRRHVTRGNMTWSHKVNSLATFSGKIEVTVFRDGFLVEFG